MECVWNQHVLRWLQSIGRMLRIAYEQQVDVNFEKVMI